MDRQELRLELIKIAFRHDRHPKDVVQAAEVLEKYVAEPQPESPKKSGQGHKQQGTSG